MIAKIGYVRNKKGHDKVRLMLGVSERCAMNPDQTCIGWSVPLKRVVSLTFGRNRECALPQDSFKIIAELGKGGKAPTLPKSKMTTEDGLFTASVDMFVVDAECTGMVGMIKEAPSLAKRLEVTNPNGKVKILYVPTWREREVKEMYAGTVTRPLYPHGAPDVTWSDDDRKGSE